MKYFVKIDGKLVEATLEHLMDPSVKLFDAEGKEMERPQAKAPVTPPPAPDTDPMDKLVEAVGALTQKVGGIGDLSKRLEVFDARMKTVEETAKKGFVLPNEGTTPSDSGVQMGIDNDIHKFLETRFNFKRQGVELRRKMPSWNPSEETMRELFKYWGLVALVARKHPDLQALQYFQKIYGETKTALGDTGNVFPVPDVVDAEILTFARERSVMLQYARMWDMTSEKMSFPAESAGVTMSWGNTTPESDPTITEVELSATELSAYAAVRNTTLADSLSDIVSWLTECMGEASGLELDNKGFNGVGTDSPFICSGILSAACGYSVTMGAGSTAFSQLTASVLSEMIGKLNGQRKIGARFWMHGQTIHFVRDLKDANGRPIFIETVGAPMSGTIWGYPYTEVTNMPSTSASNTAFLAFGNLKYFALGRRLQVSALDVDPYGLWTTNRTRFKLYQRWALKMGLSGGFVRLLTHS